MKRLFLLILMVGSLFIGACNMPTPCDPSEIGIAGNLTPTGHALVGLTPTLDWEYPSSLVSPYPYPSGTSGCGISGYQVWLVSQSSPYYDIGGDVSGFATTSFTTTTLQPVTTYYWQVRAVSSSGPGPWSGRHAFVTGPLCSPSALTAPSAWRPTGTVNTLRPTFNWYVHQPTCMPGGAHFELSLDPGFGSTVATFDGDLNPRNMHWVPESDLLDCTDYYWRVATKSGSTLGPYTTNSFRTQVGSCPLTFIFIPFDAANCRIGPNPLYDRRLILTRGLEYPVTAQHMTADGLWYKLNIENDLSCWVSDVTGNFDGDPNKLPDDTDFPPLPDKPSNDGGGSQGQCPPQQEWYCSVTQYPPVCYCRNK
jgi:hypothetical protein